MSELTAFLAALRENGVTEITLKLSPDPRPPLLADPAGMVELSSAELERMLTRTEPDENKEPGQCAAPGCTKPSGSRLVPDLCRDHALAAAGVI